MFILDESYWTVQPTTHKGRGVFARKSILPGTVIGDYLGRVANETDDDEKRDGFYAMAYSGNFIIRPDPSTVGVHLVNHSCMPNCAIFPYRDHMLYVSLREIFPEEELTVHYLISPETDADDIPHPCLCNTIHCHGSMTISERKDKEIEIFFRKRQGKWYDHPTAAVGEYLPKLSEYPTAISDYPVYDLFGSLVFDPFPWEKSQFPDIPTVRQLIRQHGTSIHLMKQKLVILGVENDCILSLPFEHFLLEKQKLTL